MGSKGEGHGLRNCPGHLLFGALLKAGDVLLLPAFWLHYIVHLPRDSGGRCIALTFTKQRDLGGRGLGLRPFAAEIAAFHAYAVYKALN